MVAPMLHVYRALDRQRDGDLLPAVRVLRGREALFPSEEVGGGPVRAADGRDGGAAALRERQLAQLVFFVLLSAAFLREALER